MFDSPLTSEQVFAHNLPMRRTHVRWSRVSASVLGAALVVNLVGSRAGAGTGTAARAPVRMYVVLPGDTVWSIARAQVGREADPRPLVDRLIRMNHLRDALISPGQRLVLPS